jgi:hypothetical protein
MSRTGTGIRPSNARSTSDLSVKKPPRRCPQSFAAAANCQEALRASAIAAESRVDNAAVMHSMTSLLRSSPR